MIDFMVGEAVVVKMAHEREKSMKAEERRRWRKQHKQMGGSPAVSDGRL